MSTPTGNGPHDPRDVPPEDQPGWGAPPPPPGYGQAPGYGQPYPAAPGYDAPSPTTPQMDMGTAVQSVLGQYANFTGRARRSEFWWFFLASFLASIAASLIDLVIGSAIVGNTGIVGLLLSLALVAPTLAVGARRLHDTGRSGWWQLIALTGIGYIVLIVFWVQDGDPTPNQHGPSPKYQALGGY